MAGDPVGQATAIGGLIEALPTHRKWDCPPRRGFTNPQSLANFVMYIPAMVDQPGSNWALGNHCFHAIFEALPLNSEASKRCRWGEPHAVGTVPPSMTYSVPVMEAARGEARNATRSATSRGFAGRPSGMPPSESITILRPPS